MKIQPPMKEPTIPKIMSVMQPKPRPREIFPASQPASRPMTIQPQNPLGSAIQKPRVSYRELIHWTDIQPPRNYSYSTGLGIAEILAEWLLLRHAVDGAEAEDKVAAGDTDYFPGGKESGKGVEGCAV